MEASRFFPQFSSTVVSCQPAQIDALVAGKKSKLDGYEVILEDTVFFPEGGGQVKYPMITNL